MVLEGIAVHLDLIKQSDFTVLVTYITFFKIVLCNIYLYFRLNIEWDIYMVVYFLYDSGCEI